ncbi:MAG: hypothetical protein QHC90_26070 [Shinella sp.]|jgi:hypothetical protein|nr:hypothetical protein [Shinella sp.]
MNNVQKRPSFGRVLLTAAGILAAVYAASIISPGETTLADGTPTGEAETFRLIHAIGNTEQEAARDLSRHECEERKRQLKAAGEAVGTYNEKLGIGSITCLPESDFEN